MFAERAEMFKHQRLLSQIAAAYYEQKKTQEDIARYYNISHSKVSQLISEAQYLGIVDIFVDYPDSWHEDAKNRLRQFFPDTTIFVINTQKCSISAAYDAVCSAAADYLNGIISNRAVMSISRGKTMFRMLQLLEPYQTYPGMLVLQLSGMMEYKEPFYEEMDLVRRVAEIYGCHCRCFALPYIIQSKELRDQLIQFAHQEDYYTLISQVDILFSSVSTLEPWKYGFDQRDYQTLLNTNTIGSFEDIFLDIQVNVVNTPLSDRLIAPSEAHIRNIKNRICVASGGYKARSLLAALRSGLVTTVFLDSNLAIKVLNLLEPERYEI